MHLHSAIVAQPFINSNIMTEVETRLYLPIILGVLLAVFTVLVVSPPISKIDLELPDPDPDPAVPVMLSRFTLNIS